MTIRDVNVSAENPRYFAVDGTPVFLLGATHPGGWYPISDPDREFVPELDRLGDVVDRVDSPHVRGLVRVVPYFPGRDLQPWSYDAETDRYDLESFDPDWEPRLRRYVEAAAERDLVVSLELWDDWSITRGVGGASDPGPEHAWNAHPFNPENNCNYTESVLPTETSSCGAPFYATVPENSETSEVLACQKRYAAEYARIVADYPNVICNVSNESRADLTWSRYWTEYLQDEIDADRLVGDMPSTTQDGDGQCDPEFAPPALFSDDRYDYVDCAQALSSHSFGDDVDALVTGAGDRMRTYAEHMDATDSVKPAVVSKDYTNTEPAGRPVIWSKFLAGTASVRFHRHGVFVWDEDGADEDVAFAFNTIEHLGRFVAETAFWRHRPAPDVVSASPSGAPTLARADPGREYVVQVVDGAGGTLGVDLEPGTYEAAWFDPGTGQFVALDGDGDASTIEAAKASVRTTVPAGTETQIFHARRQQDTDAT